jgi:hypothetical protein
VSVVPEAGNTLVIDPPLITIAPSDWGTTHQVTVRALDNNAQDGNSFTTVRQWKLAPHRAFASGGEVK